MNVLSNRHLKRWALCLAVTAPAPLWAAGAAAQDQLDLEVAPCGANAAGENLLGLYVGTHETAEGCKDPAIDPRLKRYKPQYELWSDDADKERFILLPQAGEAPTEAEKIDIAKPDRWDFPDGTILYKTFSRGGKRIETRKIYFDAAAETPEWKYEAYAWSEDQRTTTKHDGGAAPIDPTHYIPSNDECFECHQQYMGGDDPILGFSALQLNHGDSETTLESIQHFFKNSTHTPVATTDATAPDSSDVGQRAMIDGARIPAEQGSIEEEALGYLHGNCSNCHGGSIGFPAMKLWVPVGTESVAKAPVSVTGVCECVQSFRNQTIPGTQDKYKYRIAPGEITKSAVFRRMSAPGVFGARSPVRMPPIATVTPHAFGVDQVATWISELPIDSCTKVCP